ncbi:MAG: hypothetical protein P8Z36_09830 [Gemmatimonadota bacterium]
MHKYRSRRFTASVITFALLIFAAADASAQEPTQSPPPPALPTPQAQQAPAMSPALQDTLRTLLVEAQQIQQRLANLQQQAIEANDALSAERDSIEQQIEATVVATDSQAAGRIARLKELEVQFDSARAAQDTAKLQSVVAEAQTLNQQVQQARMAAMQQDSIANRIDAFREKLLAGMRKIEPRTDSLIARVEAIAARLQQK